MAESKSKHLGNLHLRANLPRYFRYGAVGLLAITMLVIGVGFFRARSNPEFRMKGFPTSLSKDVLATVDGYERTETDGGVRKYFIKADRATTFSDNHQELENVFLQVFDDSGESSDRITALRTVYVPNENKNFTAYMAGNVDIETRDALKVKTEQVIYKKADEVATADETVKFERDNIRGSSFGAVVRIAEKKIDLLRDVKIEQFETVEAMNGAAETIINAGFASYDQLKEKIELNQGLMIDTDSKSPVRETNVTANRASVFLVAKSDNSRDVNKLELFDAVAIESREAAGGLTKINSGYALYEKNTDRFDLRNAVNIVTAADQTPTTITASRAIYEQSKGFVNMEGPAEINQANDLIRGQQIDAQIYPSKKLKTAHVRGDGYLRQIETERTMEISAGELNAAFADGQTLIDANALGNAVAVMIPTTATEYSKVTMSAPRSIGLRFNNNGILEKMLTDGRTTIQLDAPNNSPDSANKRVTADSVKTFLFPDGKNIQRAEAVGNAELFVEPLSAAPENYRTTVNAPRFDCEFFPVGNNAKNCVAEIKTKTVRVPTVAAADRGNQIITAERLNTSFSEKSKDVERLEANGNTKFVELDRNAIADQMTFTTDNGIVTLRGGEPTVWDSGARAKAREIDWDTKNQKSFLRGNVSTTYYSQRQTGDATPFGKSDKPVFITSANAEIDHKAEMAVYTGNARGWQENNYVRAESLTIQQKLGQFDAEGNVQSLLYNATRRENGKDSIVPVSASSGSMTYFREKRLLRYLKSVDIRQATDRITGGKADVYLSENNEVSQTDIEQNVVITQPTRKAYADFAMYIAADESVLLRGNPARVEDAENGSSQAAQMKVLMRENRVTAEGKSTKNTAGRTRSVYKVKTN